MFADVIRRLQTFSCRKTNNTNITVVSNRQKRNNDKISVATIMKRNMYRCTNKKSSAHIHCLFQTNMMSLTFYTTIHPPQSASIPNYYIHNPKPASKHTLSLSPSSYSFSKFTTNLHSRVYYKTQRHQRIIIKASSETMTTEKLGIKIVKNPPESQLSDLGVRSWPKWGCPPSKFPWTYTAKETCFLLKGKVKVYPEGSDEGVEIGAGDLVVFPKGMNCTWDVSETVDKHYQFE